MSVPLSRRSHRSGAKKSKWKPGDSPWGKASKSYRRFRRGVLLSDESEQQAEEG